MAFEELRKKIEKEGPETVANLLVTKRFEVWRQDVVSIYNEFKKYWRVKWIIPRFSFNWFPPVWPIIPRQVFTGLNGVKLTIQRTAFIRRA